VPYLRCWYPNGSIVLRHDASYSSSATIEGHYSQQKFLDLTLTTNAKGTVQDIKEDNFWKCMYILLCAVFPALRAL
jgi:hypothetical protein